MLSASDGAPHVSLEEALLLQLNHTERYWGVTFSANDLFGGTSEWQPARQQFLRESVLRKNKLTSLFAALEDGQETIRSADLMRFGKALRELGHKTGEWTAKKNNRAMGKIDADNDNRINVDEFVGYFDRTLPHHASLFDLRTKQYLEAATRRSEL